MATLWIGLVATSCCATSHCSGQSEESPFAKARSKKGLQVERVDDAIDLGVDHAAININLCQLVDPHGKGGTRWKWNGKEYSFHTPYLNQLDRQVAPLSKNGMLVYAILLTYLSGDDAVNKLMIHPDCAPDAPNRLGAFNTSSEVGREWYEATIAFLSDHWSGRNQDHGEVVGWIVGNEVNSHWWWYNMGRCSMEQVADAYLVAVRLTHRAVQTSSPHSRVYLSLEHHWNMRYPPAKADQAFAAKGFLEYFAEQSRRDGDFDWHIAFHPYPENLFEPRFWKDKTATPSIEAKRITFRNLEYLVTFLETPSMLCEGKTRRIILSEQGFHTPETDDGELVQAAAYCYAYRIVERMPEIDAFILHRHIDHPNEGGLHLGLRRRAPKTGEVSDPNPQKKIYECFRDADTDRWEETFRFALPIVGLEQWPTEIPHR